jgi:membrane-bound serine protease (ClpP class)
LASHIFRLRQRRAAPYTESALGQLSYRLGLVAGLLAVIGIVLTGPVAPAQSSQPVVIQIDVDQVVHPLTAEIVANGVAHAESIGAAAVLIRLNTPGGLLSATEEIIQTILGSRVPIVTYVSPSGGKAASAGFMILVAGDVAAMAPGTNTGAAHPVLLGGGEMDAIMKQKVENDSAARMRAIADARGRNAELAEQAVISSRSFTEEEALEANLIELVAASTADLLTALNGRTVIRFDGTETKLALDGAVVEPVVLSYRQKILLPLTDPSLALIVLVLGALGVYIEFTNPGLILPGVAGGILILVGLMALSLLPINWAGAGLIAFGVACLVLEAFVLSHGILAAGGIGAMVLGMVILVDTEVPELSIGWGIAMMIVVPFALITVFLLQLAVRSFRYKVTTGIESLVGVIGQAKTEIGQDGRVFVHGELWNATAATPIATGTAVRIVTVEGLRLTVEPAEPASD